MIIYLGSDHNGFHLKSVLKDFLTVGHFRVADDGDKQLDPDDDFPVFASRVVHSILSSKDKDPKGILICGSAQGMVMAANRFKGIRACLAWDIESARSSRNDDDSNIICLPARILKDETSFSIVTTWLNTPFAGSPRFVRRIEEMDNLS
jgi:ribose 5-phosphate isomerase B